MFDLTVSMPLVGRWVGRPFVEKLGVREGGVESPHLFNAYIDGVRTRLERLHPRICKLLELSIAILLYADDAALPADTLEDLRISIAIFEQFCNERHLFISTPKTFLTVFHSPTDRNVVYDGDKVFVDGQVAEVHVYGSAIAAAQSFKYLGVWINSTGTADTHLDNRMLAFHSAAASLRRGLARIPCVGFAFLQYLWKTLVEPVPTHGVELYAFCSNDASNNAVQLRVWKTLLRASPKSSNGGIQVCSSVGNAEVK